MRMKSGCEVQKLGARRSQDFFAVRQAFHYAWMRADIPGDDEPISLSTGAPSQISHDVAKAATGEAKVLDFFHKYLVAFKDPPYHPVAPSPGMFPGHYGH